MNKGKEKGRIHTEVRVAAKRFKGTNGWRELSQNFSFTKLLWI